MALFPFTAHAVAQIGRFKTSGLIAQLLWLFVHIIFLIGFRNRLVVMTQWAWSCVTFDRSARLITETLNEPLGRDKRRYHDASGYLADELLDELRSFTSSAR